MSALPDLTCREFVQLVTDYLENALDPEAREQFEEHLAACESCPIYLEQIRQTMRVSGSLSPESLSAESWKTLLDAFRDWHRA